MVIKSYFDGGNSADSTLYDVVTLAAISGRIDQWKSFEDEWSGCLGSQGARWLHTTDAVSLNKPFSRADGWDEHRRDSFIAECVNVAERHIARPLGEIVPPRDGLLPFTVTVVLDDFKRARDVNPDVPKNATEIMATQALNACLEWGQSRGADFWHLFFDQNEPYCGHVSDRQRNPRALKQVPLLKRIFIKPSPDMRRSPALQLADMFAWCVSHKNKHRHEWHRDLINLKRLDRWLGYDDLVNPIPGVADLVEKWKLPRRRPTP
jgi:hypothetical protein